MTWTIFGYDVFETIIELLIIWLSVFLAFRFLQGTRGGGVIRGLVVLLLPLWLLQVLADWTGHFDRLDFFAEQFLTYVFLLLIIIFQPELRQAAVRVSQSELFARFRNTPSVGGTTISAIADASVFLSRNQFGGLIAIERDNSTNDHVVGGQSLDAEVNSPLLKSIFWPNNPLHDLGCIVRGDRIVTASVQFPLADDSAMLSSDLGSRHRAGVGLSMRCDALIIIISEQTGRISFAEHGVLTTINRDDLEVELAQRLNPKSDTSSQEQNTDSEDVTSSTSIAPGESTK
ncbi:MAG: DNA integrity scanning protein DisA nucleotide-binding domain protein [Phycisphaerales bacterium]|nr:DNA integrity scanning protein DisA nucleotide-binding domain protein [Planctomycetota bacterium]MBL6997072.1 DNA integrity scanning protein DisA nucleotide-binding domain protein [Phycisphaerales bacterium]